MSGLAGPAPATTTWYRRHSLALAAGLLALTGGAALARHFDRPVAAAPLVAKLELTGRVVDRANVLDAAQERTLTAMLEQLERQAGPQFVVATTPSLRGETVEHYSLRLARVWGLGSKQRNDGLLLLVAPAERKVRIEVGKGLETALPDPLCAAIIEREILPHYRQGDLARGTLAGANALVAVLTSHPTLPRETHTQ